MNDAPPFAAPADVMRRALELAHLGEGAVEPNPMVGAVVVDEQLRRLGEGYHERFGGPHAEVHALTRAGSKARGQTLYVTLEPCCHQGKTPPCVDAILEAGIRRVVIGMQDPFEQVAGQGIARLRQNGVDVEVGLLEPEVRRLNAPFCKLVETGLPWVHAKWAMTLDGKIAARTGHSRWISNAQSRAVVHRLRGRMDAIVVGIGTATADDPLLTARPPGPRNAARIVLDGLARLSITSRLATTAREVPVLVVTTAAAPPDRIAALQAAGVEFLVVARQTHGQPALADPAKRDVPDVAELLRVLGQRRFTNVLVEGGSAVLGAFFDRQLIDEAHVFIAPKLVGGKEAVSPIGGLGLANVPEPASLEQQAVEILGQDVYIHGRIAHRSTGAQ